MFPAQTSPTEVEPDEVPLVSLVPWVLVQSFECASVLPEAEVLRLKNNPQPR